MYAHPTHWPCVTNNICQDVLLVSIKSGVVYDTAAPSCIISVRSITIMTYASIYRPFAPLVNILIAVDRDI